MAYGLQSATIDGDVNNTDVWKSSLRERGYTVFPFPVAIKQAMRGEVKRYIESASGSAPVPKESDADTLVRLTHLLSEFDDNRFVDVFQKANRFFSNDVARMVYGFVEELSPFLGGSRTGINFVSPQEIASNPSLTPQSFDVFWRCVRPGKPDVGPAHADFQFWEIHRGTPSDVPCPFEYNERWKIWLPLWGCTTSNSLRMIPHSHTENIPFIHREIKGRIKPDITPQWLSANENRLMCPLETFADTCILFHDKMVHKGPSNPDQFLRISSEFTIILKK